MIEQTADLALALQRNAEMRANNTMGGPSSAHGAAT